MSNGSLIVLKKDGSEGSRFLIEEDNVYKIGPGLDCHLRFNVDKDVRTNVCTISTKKKGTVKLKKLSSYPILVNNRDITSPKNLKTGDVIRIGSKIFRWDSEITKSENTATSSQKKIPSARLICTPFAGIRGRRRSSIMKTRKRLAVENLSTWQETNESIVSSKAETDSEKFTVSASPVKVSIAADCIVQNDKQQKLHSSRGATNSTKPTTCTPKIKVKASIFSKIPIATDNIHTAIPNEVVKTPVVVFSPVKTPNIKAIKSACKKSASIKKSSDNIMQAKKWKISDITDDIAKATSPELLAIDAEENENNANISSNALSTSNALFNKHEETPKLRTASANKKLITNKSHTEIKKVNKKLRRGSLPTEPDVDSPMIKELMISAKTVATDDLTSLLQSDLSTRRSLYKKQNNQSKINLQTTSSEEENLITDSQSGRRSMRKKSRLSLPSESLLNKSDLKKNDQLNISENLNVSLPNRRSLRMENRLSSLQVNSSLNKSESKPNNQSTIAQSDSPLTKSLHKEQRNSSVQKSDYKEKVSQSDENENSPQPRKSLRQHNLFTSSVKKHENEDPLNNTQSETFSTRKSLRKEMQSFDISQSELSVNESVYLLDISQPELSASKRSARKEGISTRKSLRKDNLLDITENNLSRRTSMRKSCNPFNISQNMSGVGYLNDGNDLIDWDTPEQSNVAKSESPDHADIESANLTDLKEETPEIASGKKTTARKVLKSPLNDLTDVKGVRALMKTPGRGPKTPKNDLTDVRGVRQLVDPKEIKSPKNDLTNVAGVKALLKTPCRKGRSPKNDLTNVQGVKRLMKPFREPQSPENDLTEVLGVKKLLRTPKIQNSPLNNLTDVRGVRDLLKTPGQKVKSPKNDLSDVRGIKRLMNPLKHPKSPENDLTEVAGVKSLFRSPKIQNSPNNDLSNVKGVKSLMKTPGRKQQSPKNDLSDVRGVKQLMDPKLVKSPENDLSDIRGVKQLFKRNNMPRNDLTHVEDVRHLFVTLEKSHNKSGEMEENKTTRVSSMDDLFNELKYENEPSDSPLSHLRKSPIRTYERKAMSLSPIKRDADNINLKNRYSERIVQGPSAHVQKWIEEHTVLSSNREDNSEIDTHTVEASVEPEVFQTQSKPINQRVVRTKNLEDIENTSDVELTPRTRTRRQQIKAAEETASLLTQSRRGKIEPLSVEGITKVVVEQEDVPPKKRGRPKKTTTNITDTENVAPPKTRRGRGKDTAEDEIVEQVVIIQKTTRRMRNNEKTAVETVEVIQNNAIEDVNILDSLGIAENEKKKTTRKRTKAETDLDADTIENESSKRQRKAVEDDGLEISRHVKFDIPDFGTPAESKRTRRGTKKTEIKTEDYETKPTVKRGRNARKKEADETEHVSEIVEPVPQTTEAQIDTVLPVKRGRNTRKKEQDESEEKVEKNEPKPTQKRGRAAKKITAKTDENDINATNVPAKPTRRTRVAKVTKEIEKTEDTEEESTGKKTQRKRRSPNTESTSDEKADGNSDSSTKTRRKKADDNVAEQEDVNLPTKSTKRTRTNVVKEQEEPVRKSTRTRKAKS